MEAQKTKLLSIIALPIFLSLVGCTHVFYQPDTRLYATPKRFNIDYEEHWINSQDSLKLHAWLLKSPKENKGLVLYFHGNAQNISSHFHHLAWITQYGYDLLIFDYRGYGLSQGRPTQRGVVSDGLAALKYAHQLKSRRQYDKLVVYAKSLGGIVAAKASMESDFNSSIDLLVLDSTFDSYQKIAKSHLQSTWLTWPFSFLSYLLISDSQRIDHKLDQLSNLPVLVIHGSYDEIVPLEFGKRIYDKIPGEKKSFWQIQTTHNQSHYHMPNHEKARLKLLNYFDRQWPTSTPLETESHNEKL